jgi:hypothetical protein
MPERILRLRRDAELLDLRRTGGRDRRILHQCSNRRDVSAACVEAAFAADANASAYVFLLMALRSSSDEIDR